MDFITENVNAFGKEEIPVNKFMEDSQLRQILGKIPATFTIGKRYINAVLGDNIIWINQNQKTTIKDLIISILYQTGVTPFNRKNNKAFDNSVAAWKSQKSGNRTVVENVKNSIFTMKSDYERAHRDINKAITTVDTLAKLIKEESASAKTYFELLVNEKDSKKVNEHITNGDAAITKVLGYEKTLIQWLKFMGKLVNAYNELRYVWVLYALGQRDNPRLIEASTSGTQ